ncbi:MAG: (d)CMP kinase [Thermodesulfovibrionales bacterium]|nr:(d)CMP kinase [Thermodesulfovibrionales bacterium]
MRKVIAIDGPSGAGKSTVAKRLAAEFGFRYLDTGALYRAIALGLVNNGIREDASDETIRRALNDMKVEFTRGRVTLDGLDVEDSIRLPEIGHCSSVFSARGPVREHLMPVQKLAAENNDIVVEGRDMTTVVFPDAWIKVYLDASVEARAKRRFDQLREKGIEADMEGASRDVTERDERDSSRDIAPLRRADDALYIDSSNLSALEVIAMVKKACDKEAVR